MPRAFPVADRIKPADSDRDHTGGGGRVRHGRASCCSTGCGLNPYTLLGDGVDQLYATLFKGGDFLDFDEGAHRRRATRTQPAEAPAAKEHGRRNTRGTTLPNRGDPIIMYR